MDIYNDFRKMGYRERFVFLQDFIGDSWFTIKELMNKIKTRYEIGNEFVMYQDIYNTLATMCRQNKLTNKGGITKKEWKTVNTQKATAEQKR